MKKIVVRILNAIGLTVIYGLMGAILSLFAFVIVIFLLFIINGNAMQAFADFIPVEVVIKWGARILAFIGFISGLCGITVESHFEENKTEEKK